MDTHLTVSEARSLTGKSESTLKRMIREVVSAGQHPDRPFILPSPEEVERRKVAKEPYAWKIERSLLLRRFPAENSSEEGSGGDGTTEVGSAPPQLMLQILREQLSSKDQQLRTLETQLDRKDEQIANLSERMRESNVLMRELQQRLAIAPPQPPTDRPLAAASIPQPHSSTKAPLAKASPKAKPTHAPTAATKKPPAKARRGVFARLFGRSK